MDTIGSKIRAYFRAQIAAAAGLDESSVKRSPRFQVNVEELPVIAVYTHADRSADPDAISSRAHERIYTVAVEVNVAARVEEDGTDALAQAIRKAVLSDSTLGGLVAYTTWTSQEWGGKETAVAESATLLLFSCHYMWRPEW